MKFEEALLKLKNGEKIRRKFYDEKYYIYLDKNGILRNSSDSYVSILGQNEILADDWEIYNDNGEGLIGKFCYNKLLKNICIVLEYVNYQYTVLDENGDIWHIGDDCISNIDLDICKNKNVYISLLDTMKNIHNRLENK